MPSGPNRVVPPLRSDPDGTFDTRYWPRSEPLPEGAPGPQGPSGPQGPKAVIVSTTEPTATGTGDLWYDPVGEPQFGEIYGITEVEADAKYAAVATVDPLLAYPDAINAAREGLDLTGTTDATSDLLALATDAASRGVPLYLPEGEVLLTSVELPDNAHILTAGIGRTRIRRTASADTGVFTATGAALGSAIALASNGVEGAATVSVAATTGITAGGWVLISSTRTITGGAATDAQLARVLAISGSGPYTLTLAQPLVRAYATADGATVTPYAPKRVRLDDVDIAIEGGAQGRGFYGLYGDGHVLNRVRVTGFYNAGITVQHATGCRIVDADTFDPSVTGAGQGYGVHLGIGSTFNDVVRSRGRRCRHDVDIHNGSSYNRVLFPTSWRSTSTSFSTHGQDCRHNLFQGGLSVGSGAYGFGAGNATYGGDPYNRFVDMAVYDSADVGGRIFMGSTGCQVINPTIVRAGTNGIEINASNECVLRGGQIRNAVTVGVQVSSSANAVIDRPVITGAGVYGLNATSSPNLTADVTVRGSTNNGVRIVSCDDVVVGGEASGNGAAGVSIADTQRWIVRAGSKLTGNATNGLVVTGTSDYGTAVGLNVENNTDPTDISAVGANNTITDNLGNYSEQDRRKKRGTATVANGGSISHGLARTPGFVALQPTVAGRIANVTAADSATVTVSLTDHAGVAIGVAEAVRWLVIA